MDLSIIINNYNSKEKTYKAIEHILAGDMADLGYEIIVVDNASQDKIGEEINNKYPDVKFVQNKKNTGMGGGNNLGIRNSQGAYLLILNPDVYVESNTIKKLHNHIIQNEDVGIIAPQLLNADGSVQNSYFKFPKVYTPILRRTFLGNIFKNEVNDFLMNGVESDTIVEVDWLLGSCLLLKRDLCPSGECFDERFFMYFEDIDLCRRIKESNQKVVYHPEVRAIHDHARASARNAWFVAPFVDKLAREHIKSWVKYFRKWGVKN